MTAIRDADLMGMALSLSHKMLGTSIDIEEAFVDAVEAGTIPFGYHDAPKNLFTFLDRKVWKCETCDHWCEPGELDEKDVCLSCR